MPGDRSDSIPGSHVRYFRHVRDGEDSGDDSGEHSGDEREGRAYQGTFGHGTRIAASAAGVAGLKPVVPSASLENVQSPRVLARFKSPAGPNAAAKATGAGAAEVGAASIVPAGKATSTSGKKDFFWPPVRHAFDGLNGRINDRLHGALTPPDQGLCVGPDHTIRGVPDAVWEVVNNVGIETTRSGAVLTPAVALPTLFQDPNSYSDPRCLFDPATQSFYFTEIGFPVATGRRPPTTTPSTTSSSSTPGAPPPTSSTPRSAATASATSRRPGSTTTRSSSPPTSTAVRPRPTTGARSSR